MASMFSSSFIYPPKNINLECNFAGSFLKCRPLHKWRLNFKHNTWYTLASHSWFKTKEISHECEAKDVWVLFKFRHHLSKGSLVKGTFGPSFWSVFLASERTFCKDFQSTFSSDKEHEGTGENSKLFQKKGLKRTHNIANKLRQSWIKRIVII